MEAGLNESARNLARAVSAEIEENYGVIVTDQATRDCRLSRSAFRRNHGGHDELVGDALFVARANSCDWIPEFFFGGAMHHRAICLLDALPAIVAIHRVVAAYHGRDLSNAVLAHLLRELAQKIDAAVGRRVASVP